MFREGMKALCYHDYLAALNLPRYNIEGEEWI